MENCVNIGSIFVVNLIINGFRISFNNSLFVERFLYLNTVMQARFSVLCCSYFCKKSNIIISLFSFFRNFAFLISITRGFLHSICNILALVVS